MVKVFRSSKRVLLQVTPLQKSSFIPKTDEFHKAYRPPAAAVDTDLDLYHRMTQALLSRNSDSYWNLALTLISSLEQRATDVSDEQLMSMVRLDGWISAIRFLAGSIHYANQFFLDRLGEVFDDSTLFERLCILWVNAIHEVNRRSPRQPIRSVEDWVAQCRNKNFNRRANLANTANYLAREAYTFRQTEALHKTLTLEMDENWDICAQIPKFSTLPIQSTKDVLFQKLLASNSQLNDYLHTELHQNTCTQVEVDPKKIPHLTRAIDLAIRTNRTLGRRNSSHDLIAGFDFSNSNKWPLSLFNLFKAELQQLTPQDTVLERKVERAISPRRPLRRGSEIETHLNNLERELSAGEFHNANLPFLTATHQSNLSLAEIHRVIQAVRNCNDIRRQRVVVDRLKKRMVSHASTRGNVSNVNILARSVELIQLDGDLRVAEDHHKALKYLTRKAALSIPSKTAKSPPKSAKLLLFCFDQDRITPNLVPALLPVLQNEGFQFFNFARDYFDSQAIPPWTFSPRLSANWRCLEGQPSQATEHLCDWVIDPKSQKITCNGLDVYQGLYERVSRVQKKFVVDWDAPISQVFLNIWITQIDRLIFALDQLREYCTQNDCTVTLVSLQSHFAPYSALRKYAEINKTMFNHVTISSSYENWASNMGGQKLSSLTMLNNTRFPHPSLPAFGTAPEFEKWYSETYVPNREELWEKWQNLTTLNRAGELTEETAQLLSLIQERKQKAKRVFCALGKIPYDLAVPYQGGAGYTDMKDWLNHICESVQGTDSLLLVKPHPHELSFQISGKPNEGFLDLIENHNNDNILLLPHRGVSFPHLDGIVDHYLCWNGSSIAELGANGTSIIAADDWAKWNYPIHVHTPDSKEHMEQFLRGEKDILMHPDFQDRSRAYVIFLSTAPFALHFPFASRSANNVNFNRAWVNWEKLKDPEEHARLRQGLDIVRRHF